MKYLLRLITHIQELAGIVAVPLTTFVAIRLGTCHFIHCTVRKYAENVVTRACIGNYHLEDVRQTICTTFHIQLQDKSNSSDVRRENIIITRPFSIK